jgi:antitoxin VapB
MSLNLKDAETVQLVRELASVTGESFTTAVRVAVRERLEKKRRPLRAGLADRILAIARETAPRMASGKTSTELIDELYDPKTGLPV